MISFARNWTTLCIQNVRSVINAIKQSSCASNRCNKYRNVYASRSELGASSAETLPVNAGSVFIAVVWTSFFVVADNIEIFRANQISFELRRSCNVLARWFAHQNVVGNGDKYKFPIGCTNWSIATKIELIGSYAFLPEGRLKASRVCSSFLFRVELGVEIFYFKVLVNADSVCVILHCFAWACETVHVALPHRSGIPVTGEVRVSAKLSRSAVVYVKESTPLLLPPSCALRIHIVHLGVPSRRVQQGKWKYPHKSSYLARSHHILCTYYLLLPMGWNECSILIFQRQTFAVVTPKKISNLFFYLRRR